jgi:hypothetical protein
MTRRILTLSIVGLIILLLGIARHAFSTPDPKPEMSFSATINLDCAPWDGSAFTISIPMQSGSLYVSIYQSPGIKDPTTFRFPDDTMSVGNALLTLPFGSAAQVRGSVTLQHVEEGRPVEGTFDLVTETGEQLKGKFIAEWGDEIIYCG